MSVQEKLIAGLLGRNPCKNKVQVSSTPARRLVSQMAGDLSILQFGKSQVASYGILAFGVSQVTGSGL